MNLWVNESLKNPSKVGWYQKSDDIKSQMISKVRWYQSFEYTFYLFNCIPIGYYKQLLKLFKNLMSLYLPDGRFKIFGPKHCML